MKNVRTALMVLALATALAASFALAQKSDQAEVLLKAAANKELVDGDLNAAIELYKKVVAQPGASRAAVAKALVQMGQCYEKLGETQAQEARKAYQRVVREFADQPEFSKVARERLSTMAAGPGMLVRQLWSGSDVDNQFVSISPDGRYFVYSDGNVAVHDLATGEKRHLTDDTASPAWYCKVSPDGKQVAYTVLKTSKEGSWELRVVGLNGSPPRVLYRGHYLEPRGWSPDSRHVLALLEPEGNLTYRIGLISVEDGSVRLLKDLGGAAPSHMCFSPDGRYIVYDFPGKKDPRSHGSYNIFLLAADGSSDVPLVEHPANEAVLGWSPDGKRVLFASDRTGTTDAWMIEVADGKPQGAPELVKRDVGQIYPLGFARNGSFYYGVWTKMHDVYVGSLDLKTGKLLGSPSQVSQRFMGYENTDPDWSADGHYLAYISQKRTPPRARILVICNADTGEERDLLVKRGGFVYPRWAPDGRSILLCTSYGGIYQVDPGTGAITDIVKNPDSSSFVHFHAWSPDGKAIFYIHRSRGEKYVDRILSRNLETGEERELWRGEMVLDIPHLLASPDGRQLAACSRESLRLVPAGGGELRELLKAQGAESLWLVSWTPDGRYLLFTKTLKGAAELWRIAARGGQPERLGPLPKPLNGELRLHPDGQRVAFTGGEDKFEVWVIENFLPAAKSAK